MVLGKYFKNGILLPALDKYVKSPRPADAQRALVAGWEVYSDFFGKKWANIDRKKADLAILYKMRSMIAKFMPRPQDWGKFWSIVQRQLALPPGETVKDIKGAYGRWVEGMMDGVWAWYLKWEAENSGQGSKKTSGEPGKKKAVSSLFDEGRGY